MFILARMREEYDRTGSTSQAAVRGIASTGRLVTSAALILFLSFVAMATGPETDIKIRATGLGAGILLDATIVRALLVPALVSLFGRWNWWLPARPARLLRVTRAVCLQARARRHNPFVPKTRPFAVLARNPDVTLDVLALALAAEFRDVDAAGAMARLDVLGAKNKVDAISLAVLVAMRTVESSSPSAACVPGKPTLPRARMRSVWPRPPAPHDLCNDLPRCAPRVSRR